MLVQVSVGRAVAASCEAEPGEDWPASSQVLRTDKLARNSELVLELDLVSQDVKLPFIGSKEEVSDPPQPGIEAESFFELGPVRLAQNRELDVSSRSELRPNATTAAARAPCSGQRALEYDHVDAAAGQEVRAREPMNPAPTTATSAFGLLATGSSRRSVQSSLSPAIRPSRQETFLHTRAAGGHLSRTLADPPRPAGRRGPERRAQRTPIRG